MKEENNNIEKVEDKVDNIIKKAKASGKMTYGELFLYGVIGLTVSGIVMTIIGTVHFKRRKKYLKEKLYDKYGE